MAKAKEEPKPEANPLMPDGPAIADRQRAHSAEHYDGKSAAEIQKSLDPSTSSGQAQTQVPGVNNALPEGAALPKGKK